MRIEQRRMNHLYLKAIRICASSIGRIVIIFRPRPLNFLSEAARQRGEGFFQLTLVFRIRAFGKKDSASILWNLLILLSDLLDPVLIVDVPSYRFSNAGLEVMRRFPSEFGSYFARINGVTAVMAGAILDKMDQSAGTAL